ncbi:Protein MAIN-LIKE 2 [Glycine soja]
MTNNVDNVANEVHEEPHDPITDHVSVDTKGFSGEPQDTSLLMDNAYHVVARVWTGELASHGRKVEKFGRSALKIEDIMVATTLSSLITCLLETSDKGLLYAFAKRWHKETSSLHLPIGNATITLDDVVSLLYVPITGAFHTFDAIDVEEASVHKKQKMKLTNVKGHMFASPGYETFIVANTIFVNKSATQINVVFLDAICDLSQFGGYSWGAAAPTHMYDNLNVVSKHTKKTSCRIYHSVISWIYEHFRTIASIIADEETIHLRWSSSIVRHQLERVVRQFGYCAADYMKWFYRISHLFMSPSQLKDPPRHPPVVQDDTFILLDPPMLPVLLATMPQPPVPTTTDANMPRHAMIAESLEHMINMRMVTARTNAYTLTEHCLRLA